MVYPMMVGLNLRALKSAGSNRLQGTALALNFLLMPLLGWGAGLLFFADEPALRLALLLTALLPTSGMTISWTGFAKGNLPTAVKMTVIGLIAGSLLAPLYLKALLVAVVDVPMGPVALQIALIVFLPMALKAPDIVRAPQVLPAMLLPLVLLYALNFCISTLVGRALFPRGEAIALVFGTVMRNLSIALAIAIGVFREQGADAALLISRAYIVQVQSAAWYVRFTDRFFVQPAAPAARAT